MKQTTRLFAVLCMTLVIVLLMASCDDLLSDLPFGNETTPAETTPAETTPNVTTPEATTPEVTTPEVTTPEVTTPEVTTPDGTQPSEPPHDHEFVDGKCECGFIPVFENASVYDNDGDGANDVYLFTPIIPEKFTGEDVVHVWAMDYILELSSEYGTDKNMFSTIWNNYCDPGYDEYFTYKVTVPEAGVYEMSIHTRLKDTRARGAKITINKDTENEYAFELSYQFATEEELNAARENDYTSTSYMYSIRVELQAGDNYLRIDEPTQDLRVFYFRDFYFVKVDDEIPHEHEIIDGKCECGFIPVFENASVYDNDGDGANDVYLFTPILPEKFRGEDVVHVWCMDYIPELSTSYVSDKNMFSTIYTMYCEKEFDEYFTYKVTVPEAGVYEMAIHTRLKDTRARGAKFIINKDTANEYAFELSYQFATEEELNAARENDYTSTSYMYSIRVELQAGDNYIRVEGPTQDLRVFYFRDFYFVKVADLCTEHTWGEWVTVTEPNCEEDGLQKRTCTKCYATEEAPIDDLAGFHVWRNPATIKTQITPCLQEWFDQCVCSNCGAVKSTNTRLFSTHKWGLTTVVKAPTCQEDGLTQKSCTVCGAVSETVTKTTDHQWSTTVVKVPTCQEDGLEQKVCNICGYVLETVTKTTAHQWSSWYIANDIPCGEEGSQSERVCQTCGAKETHDNERDCYVWINPTTLELGTCIQPGKVSEECQYCGKVQIREVQMVVHKWSEYVEVEPATCTQHGRKVKTCAGCGGTSDAQIYKLDHLYENGICTSCGHIEGSVTPTPIFEKESVYDNDGDGVNDTYLFSPIFPEKFENGDIIYINSGKYEKDLSSSIVGYRPYSGETQNNYWYCEEGKGQYIVYKITVAEAGVYEMAIRIRLHDTTERATKYTVNEGTENEYSFETSYQFATSAEVYEAHNNDYDQSCYMYGIYLNLVAGDNYIKLEESSLIPKAIFSRDYYFVKVVDPCTEHTWGEWVTVTEPNCEEDGLQKRTCTKCYATEEAPIDDLAGFHVWRNPLTIKTQLTPCLQEWFDQCVCSNCGAVKSTSTRLFSTHKWGLTTVVKAPTCQEDGLTQKSCTVCGAVSETVTKASDHQWSKWQLINDIPCGEEGSQSERVCQTCGIKETHDNPKACYVWINHTTLELGTCIQPGKVSEECQYCGKVQIRELQMAGHKWSEYVEVKPASCTAHGKETRTCTVCGATSTEQIYKLDHKYENGICVSCGRAENAQEPIPVVEKTSNYDNDGDGAKDVYFFTTVLPEKFKSEDTIHLWMDEYEADLSSNYVPESMFSGNYNHVYFDEGQGQYAVYKITVSQAGVYEMAIHTRLKDTKERGGKYTVNEGTEHEYSFETSFQFATDEEVYAARENEYTMSSYMYGMYLELQEGDNYIKIELASGGEKSMHWREFFFVKVEE